MNEWLPLLTNFTVKFELVFFLTLENAFSYSLHFKAKIMSIDSSKKSTRDFKNTTTFERSACFYATISGILERFQYCNFETDFLENKTFFKKLEYHFLVEITKMENSSFPCKTAISKANFKTNKMVSTKWTYHKERSFASNYFIF